ncbi:MAG: addiction module protein [Deltaproteobacteria bacterium]|nr:addiction module protein [Deltaproteobacteria bacterium]MBW2162238.1 addiction module protein [Deltaproteobacteria bacterium]MBW2404316.1 addiction module protein [Deltaproteobacteria bacterium]MBW2552143.1 addiction module protein [Deltaproteobacteria bacterium]MBW2629809.1 addiction module protein [Deltaproteobacteria bacterium]
MSWPVEKILEEAMKLDPKDRALVVAELSRAETSATPEEVEAAWRDEIARRAQGIQNGTADTVDGRELSQRVRAEYKP